MSTVHRFYLIAILVLGLFLGAAMGGSPEDAVKQTLLNYAAAIESMDIAQVQRYVVTSEAFSVFENGHVNQGWADYRDHHLAPELKMFRKIEYRYEDIQVQQSGNLAVATAKYHIAIELKDRSVTGKGLATIVLQKAGNDWKILHIHTTRIPQKKQKK
ncbi:MAG: DUF4440 domain-containing protein [Calditrichaeota bacterium]|nr:DUF4440 domain-containing protein [Calditrichota bacterium]